jgi:SAM-dependent methyltransferase
MQNAAEWQPTKFVVRAGQLRATHDDGVLGSGSRLIADLVAEASERSIKERARGRLLDMGCGKVPLYAAYRDHVSDVQCIDWENSAHRPKHLDKTCDLSGPIPYGDEQFDTIILSDVLEHLPEPANCWREMHRLLAPGGKVLLNVPFYYSIHEEPFDFYRYTEFALRRFAESAGFRVVELAPLGGAIDVLADVAGKLLAGARLAPLAFGIQSAARMFGKTAVGKRVRDRTATRFPLSYFMVVEKPSTHG